jgi:hypothetical protein
MTGPPPTVSGDVQGNSPPSDPAALTELLAGVLQRAVDRDAGLRTGWVALQRANAVLQVRLELPGAGAPPRVVVEALQAGVPQWTREDRAVLHALGIATDTDEEPRTSESGWRQPR